MDEEHREHRAGLAQRVAALEEGARDSAEGEDAQFIKLRQGLTKIGEELERHDRRIAALETGRRKPPLTPSTVEEHPTPSHPAYELVASLRPALATMRSWEHTSARIHLES